VSRFLIDVRSSLSFIWRALSVLMQRRFYFDTSVFGGVFDDEFEKASIQLFDQVKRGKVICLYSKTVEDELKRAPANVRRFIESLPPAFVERVSLTGFVKTLAENYITEKIVARRSLEDCLTLLLRQFTKPTCLLAGTSNIL
jgi:hypothetical protein